MSWASFARTAPYTLNVSLSRTHTLNEKPKPELYAIIAASIAATFGSKAVIRGIKSEGSSSLDSFLWALEGRRQIYSSHKVR